MERVLIVVTLRADGNEPGDELRAGRAYRWLEFRFALLRAEISRYLGAERMLLKVGAFPLCVLFVHAWSFSRVSLPDYAWPPEPAALPSERMFA